jgi:hypothetical protein
VVGLIDVQGCASDGCAVRGDDSTADMERFARLTLRDDKSRRAGVGWRFMDGRLRMAGTSAGEENREGDDGAAHEFLLWRMLA